MVKEFIDKAINRKIILYKTDQNTCLQCRQKWLKRTNISPRCPRCKTSKWNDPRLGAKLFRVLEEDFVVVDEIFAGAGKQGRFMAPMFYYGFMALRTKDHFHTYCSDYDWALFQAGQIINWENKANFYELRNYKQQALPEIKTTAFFMSLDLDLRKG